MKKHNIIKLIVLGMAGVALTGCSLGLNDEPGVIESQEDTSYTETARSEVESMLIESSILEDNLEVTTGNDDESPVEDISTPIDGNQVNSGYLVGTSDYHEGVLDPLPQATYDNPIPSGYTLIQVDGGNLSGYREANVVVNIGFNDGPIQREYYSYTNEHGQVIKVIAKEIILQDESIEPIKSSGRYYHDEAKVPGVESSTLDEGHVIADSLGGVANAYNITPQNSTLNRHGDQAEFEQDIRKSNGAKDFIYIITYPNNQTQTPDWYYLEYTNKVSGQRFRTNFPNNNPDDTNRDLGVYDTPSQSSQSNQVNNQTTPTTSGELSSVDTNGNGRVTIQEAKDAGYSMPIYSDHWLYQYMHDADGDGMVGE